MLRSDRRRRFAEVAAPGQSDERNGGFMILALFCFIGCLAFVALSVDVGYISMQKTRMQNAVDAAALAAAQEITHAVQTAPQGTQDITAYSLDQARAVAANVASLNGVYINPQTDVIFGTRTYNAGSQTYGITWGQTPANVVKVVARRDGSDPAQPDGKLKLFFAGASGSDQFANVTASAVAYIESRDLVVVHDFSLSMNYDSCFNSYSTSHLTNAQIISNLQYVWDDLQPYANFGGLTFEPRYMSLTQSESSVTATVTFRYDRADITTNGTLQSVRINYASGNATTHSVSGRTANNLGANNRDINKVTVTSIVPNPSQQTQSSNSVSITYTANRQQATVSSSTRLQSIVATFADGTTHTQSWNSNGPTSFTYNQSKEIRSLVVRRQSLSSAINFSPTPYTVTQDFDDTNANVRAAFGLDRVSYPANSGNWDGFINHSRTNSYVVNLGYREMYGGATLVNHILQNEYGNSKWPQLGRTRHYPFHSIKEGHELLCNFLDELGFDDHLGMVSYDQEHRIENTVNEVGLPYVNIANKPITNDYAAVNNLMKYKQAAHYGMVYTNMGGGLKRGIELLDNSRRAGSRPTIILMTDGNANRLDSGENGNLPSGWSWDKLFDYDNDGRGDYTTTDTNKRNVLKTAYNAYQKGYTVHTMSVGADADSALMKAVAHVGGGHHIDVPGGLSVIDMEGEVRDAFHKIASFVPPAKLLSSE